jgi:hypothetical protein
MKRLFASILIAIFVGCTFEAQAQVPAAQPRLPVVWHFAPQNVKPGSMQAFATKGGEVVLRWRERVPRGAADIERARAFFSGDEVIAEPGERLAFRFGTGEVAEVLNGVAEKVDSGDGSVIQFEAWNNRDCWRGPDNVTLVRRGRPGASTDIWRRNIYLLLPKPQVFGSGMNGNCPEGRFPRLVDYTRPVVGGFIDLPDRTFLIVDSDGLVIRFDRDMRTRSTLLNRSVFVLDSGTPPMGLMETLTGKNYYPENGPARYQEALDDLRDHILKLKGNKQ